MQPAHAGVTVLAPPWQFGGPQAWLVRHNWFKDLRFEHELQEVLLHQMRAHVGCIACERWNATWL